MSRQAFVRTVVPFIVSTLVLLVTRNQGLAQLLMDLNVDVTSPVVYSALTVVVGSVYHAVATYLQARFPNNALVAYLLGAKGLPSYESAATKATL